MAEQSETTEQSCAVCGRRLLTGERPSPYVSREGAEVTVCELCKVRAESAGWKRPEEVEAGAGTTADRRRRRRRGDLLGGLLARGERRQRGERDRPESEGSDKAAATEEPRPEGVEEAGSTAAPERDGEESANARRRKPRRQQASSPPAERGAAASVAGPDVNEAIAAFNASENRRTIAGLSRSLGEPRVSAIAVRTASGATGARLTVAWELAWYQWEVGPGKRGPEIRQIAKGETIDQLHAADRKWNLKMDADGTLGRRPAPET